MNKKKPIYRLCIATRTYHPKEDLFRIYIDKNHHIDIDLKQQSIGRGAYLLKREDVIQLAQKRKILSKALKAEVDDEIYERLLKLLEEQNKEKR